MEIKDVKLGFTSYTAYEVELYYQLHTLFLYFYNTVNPTYFLFDPTLTPN